MSARKRGRVSERRNNLSGRLRTGKVNGSVGRRKDTPLLMGKQPPKKRDPQIPFISGRITGSWSVRAATPAAGAEWRPGEPHQTQQDQEDPC